MSKKLMGLAVLVVLVIAMAALVQPNAYAARNWVLLDQDIEHGSIEIYNSPDIDKGFVNDNVIIHMIVAPDEGYDLKEWNVRYSDGTPIEVLREDPSSMSLQNYYFFKIPERSGELYIQIHTPARI